jgi:hypothetical protein
MITGGVAGITVFLILGMWAHPFTLIPGMFRLNKECQEEGYYTADFEFKFLGIAYYLDKGHYATALSRIRTLHHQLKTRQGLIKVPRFSDKNQEFEFYRNLQNPKTGAFMDDTYPVCTYTGPTGNVLNHLAALARETGRPLTLKYPLKYLDTINSPEKLKKFLDDAATVGALASKFPQTSFHFTRCLLSLFYEDNVVEKYGLYKVPPEWKKSLLKWFFDNQDPNTGLWGPKSKNGKLRKKDTMNTSSILKAFIDSAGHDLHEEFPLRYRDRLARSFLETAFEPVPKDDEIDKWHEWNLNVPKSIRTIIWLWDGLSPETRDDAKRIMENYVRIHFQKFYIEREGAFSNYPQAHHATLDGTGGVIANFKRMGVFSAEQQLRLWGHPDTVCEKWGNVVASKIGESDFDAMLSSSDVNSVRFYAADPGPGNYLRQLLGMWYPRKTSVVDAAELLPKLQEWLRQTPQSMGNWTSREDLMSELGDGEPQPAPIIREKIPIDLINGLIEKNGAVVAIGFDVLQLPVGKKNFRKLGNGNKNP